ncbi:MAG: DUF1343 domain-containing protein [Bryobacterales bacterium]|nr:DUF1343 domain-containing protein [Bryobacterales bacterium]
MRRLAACFVLFAAAAAAQTFSGSPALDAEIQKAIKENQIPGAVLWIGHKGKVIHRKAYGRRALVPRPEPMTLNTIFDCASLTKVVATTSALMKLFEEGKFRLNEPVNLYLKDFQGGKSEITIRNLLTHFSGLRPDLDLEPEWSGYQTGVKRAFAEQSVAPPGARLIYSDINFILLGELVRELSGQTLPEYVRRKVFLPLGMKETMFNPPASLRRRIAPTEVLRRNGPPLRGVVHDETTRYMGGVAGHAGLFSTAADLARFCEMMLGKGTRAGVRIFSPLTVAKFTSPQSPPDQPVLRGLGWDIDSPFAGNRGELFPIGSYGHTGFTGTSIWIDPSTQTYVILLSNSVHPFRRPAITSLRGRVATITAAALGIDVPGVSLTGYNETLSGPGARRTVARNGEVLTGLDVLVRDKFAPLQGKRVGLITNHTGIDREGRRNLDRMLEAGVQVAAVYSPEHGFMGSEDREDVADWKDPATGVHVWSLYAGKTRRPTDAMLRGVDALVFDIQDIGARFYTYTTTMAYAMEEAAKRRIPFFVLDRPNPITGVRVEGPVLEKEFLSFVGYFPMPVRHGMTMGEMAAMFNGENGIGAELRVIAMQGWQRGDWFDSTGLEWVNPSPNMRSLNAATLYPGVALIESSRNYSVGRGTDTPFEIIGADFIRGRELAAYLDSRYIPGVRFYATRFQPAASNFSGKTIEGVRITVTNREQVDAVRAGLEIAGALQKLYPGKIDFRASRNLIGSEAVIRALESGEDPRLIHQRLEDELSGFLAIRQKYLMYK